MTGHALYFAALAADNSWSEELRKQFGAAAGDVRYTAKGRGPPDSDLRRLHDAFVLAVKRWEEERQEKPELMPYR